MILFLQGIFLQTGNPLADWISGITNQNQYVGDSLVVAPDWIPMATFILVAFIIFVFYRYFAISKRKANDEEYLGVIEFVIRKQGQFEAFVNKYDSGLSDSYLRGLRRNPRFVKFVDEMIRMRNHGELHLYQFYYRRTRELLIHTLRRSRIPSLIVSTAPLDSSEVAVGQSEPLWSWTTLSSEHVKTVECHSSTEKFEIEFGTRGEMIDVWLMSPLVFKPLKTEITHRPSSVQHEKMQIPEQSFLHTFKTINLAEGRLEEGKIEVKVLPYREEFAEACPHIVSAAKQVDQLMIVNTRLKTQQTDLRERDNTINMLTKDNSRLEAITANKPLRYAPPKPEKDTRFDFALWIMLVGGMTLLFSQLPRYVQGLSGVDPMLLGFIGLIAGAGLMALVKGRKEEKEKQKTTFEAQQ